MVATLSVAMFLAMTGCRKKSSSGSDGAAKQVQPTKVSPKDYPCEKIVMNLRGCVSDKNLRVEVFRTWLLEDCETLKKDKTNPQKFIAFAECALMKDCNDMSTCFNNLTQSRGK